MPNRKKHVSVGGAAGVAYAALNALDQSPFNLVLEAIGGFAGGKVGGCIPDFLDPATTPNHRDMAHSLLAVGGVLALAAKDKLMSWHQDLRDKANAFATDRLACEAGSLQAILFGIQEMTCRMLAGFVAGLLAGCLSHLVLDAGSPEGLCLICRGF